MSCLVLFVAKTDVKGGSLLLPISNRAQGESGSTTLFDCFRIVFWADLLLIYTHKAISLFSLSLVFRFNIRTFRSKPQRNFHVINDFYLVTASTNLYHSCHEFCFWAFVFMWNNNATALFFFKIKNASRSMRVFRGSADQPLGD